MTSLPFASSDSSDGPDDVAIDVADNNSIKLIAVRAIATHIAS